jgi:hypothetical protein
MSRLVRLIVPGFPHHVTQRANRRAPVFFEDAHHALYRDLRADRCRRTSVACRAYCLEASGDLFAGLDGASPQSGNMQGVTVSPVEP